VQQGVLRHLYYGGKLRRLEDYALAAPRPLFAPGNGAVTAEGLTPMLFASAAWDSLFFSRSSLRVMLFPSFSVYSV